MAKSTHVRNERLFKLRNDIEAGARYLRITSTGAQAFKTKAMERDSMDGNTAHLTLRLPYSEPIVGGLYVDFLPENQLRHCPFCGGVAEIKRPGDGRQSMIVGCTECHCELESNDSAAGNPERWDWNQRK